jgi:hypothetical protein
MCADAFIYVVYIHTELKLFVTKMFYLVHWWLKMSVSLINMKINSLLLLYNLSNLKKKWLLVLKIHILIHIHYK